MNAMLKLILFGAPTVVLSGQTVAGALSGKVLALFIYLAVTGVVHRREALADLLWSELSPTQRRSNLRYLLADLRRIVGDYLVITPQTVAFNRHAPYWLDVEVVRTTLGPGAFARSAAEIAAARALCQEEFLAGLRVRNAPAFTHWVTEQRQEFQALVAQAPQAAPTHLPKHNLPSQLTPFFGRETEIADILAHLSEDHYRLLTIIGEGGVGKTRLALAVAQAILDFSSFQDKLLLLDSNSASNDNLKSKIQSFSLPVQAWKALKFPDGVWFVPLVDVTATADLPDQLAMAIAKTLDFPLSGQGAPPLQVCHLLAHKRLLLLLDNFEQIAAHADFLLTLLQKCPGVRLLITSRRQLNLLAEYPWRLTGLPLPSLVQAADLPTTELGSYAGIALFVERARRASPPFQITAENQATVVAICHLLEGLPLGLELAAALCKEYTCAELLTLLQTNYALLTTSLPDLPARHRSIRGVLGHSWRLLDQDATTILAACAIFQGSFTPAAAFAITGATSVLLQRLVDHSVLRLHHTESGERRYDLHELVRHYAREQLARLPMRSQQVQNAHAAYYLAQIELAAPLLLQHGNQQSAIHHDLSNITAAWQHCVATHQFGLLAQSMEGLTTFYRLTGLHSAAYQLFQPALGPTRQALTAQEQPAPLFAALLINLSEFCRYLDRLDEADALVQEALAFGQAHADAAICCRACHELARLAQRRAQYSRMRERAEEAYQQACRSGSPRLQAMSLNALGASHLFLGDLTTAIHHYEAALAALRQEPDNKLEALIINNLGGVYIRRREYSAAVHYSHQAVALAHAHRNRYGLAVANTLLGNLWLDLGAFTQAQTAYTEALQILAEVREPYWENWARTGQAFLWRLDGQYAAAAQACEHVLAQVQGKMPLFEHQALTYLGDVRWGQGDVGAGEALYRRALMIQREANLRFRLAEPIFRLALLLLQERDDGKAALALIDETLQQVLTSGYTVVAEPFGVYYAGYRVLQAKGDPRIALVLQAAHRLFEDSLAKIDNPTLHQAFLTNIPWRRELWTLVQAHMATM